jgi:hypothetical protein
VIQPQRAPKLLQLVGFEGSSIFLDVGRPSYFQMQMAVSSSHSYKNIHKREGRNKNNLQSCKKIKIFLLFTAEAKLGLFYFEARR